MAKPDVYCCIAAYNEEKYIGRCLDSLAAQDFPGRMCTLVCLNGCNDSTRQIVLKKRRQYARLHIHIIQSKKGLAFAQNALVQAVEHTDSRILFVDADVIVAPSTVRVLYEELDAIDTLIVAGSWPVPMEPQKASFWQWTLYYVLHARAHYPESEVSVRDVRAYKPYAYSRPQPAITPSFEARSKIYFHGRAFMLRSGEYFSLPEDPEVVDDTYIANYVHTHYGPATIRTRYDARVLYDPYLSLAAHFRVYRRIFHDKRVLDARFPEFASVRALERTCLDWRFIASQGFNVLLRFLAYRSVNIFENIVFRLMPSRKVSDLWTYECK